MAVKGANETLWTVFSKKGEIYHLSLNADLQPIVSSHRIKLFDSENQRYPRSCLARLSDGDFLVGAIGTYRFRTDIWRGQDAVFAAKGATIVGTNNVDPRYCDVEELSDRKILTAFEDQKPGEPSNVRVAKKHNTLISINDYHYEVQGSRPKIEELNSNQVALFTLDPKSQLVVTLLDVSGYGAAEQGKAVICDAVVSGYDTDISPSGDVAAVYQTQEGAFLRVGRSDGSFVRNPTRIGDPEKVQDLPKVLFVDGRLVVGYREDGNAKLQVYDYNQAPYFENESPLQLQCTVGVPCRSAEILFGDNDGDQASLSISNSTGILQLEDGAVVADPAVDDIGEHLFTLKLDDGYGGVKERQGELVVSASSNPIVDPLPPQEFVAGDTVVVPYPSGRDPEGKSLAFEVVGNPVWAVPGPSGVSVSAPENEVGSSGSFQVVASDGDGGKTPIDVEYQVKAPAEVASGPQIKLTVPDMTLPLSTDFVCDLSEKTLFTGNNVAYTLELQPGAKLLAGVYINGLKVRGNVDHDTVLPLRLIATEDNGKGLSTPQDFSLRFSSEESIAPIALTTNSQVASAQFNSPFSYSGKSLFAIPNAYPNFITFPGSDFNIAYSKTPGSSKGNMWNANESDEWLKCGTEKCEGTPSMTDSNGVEIQMWAVDPNGEKSESINVSVPVGVPIELGELLFAIGSLVFLTGGGIAWRVYKKYRKTHGSPDYGIGQAFKEIKACSCCKRSSKKTDRLAKSNLSQPEVSTGGLQGVKIDKLPSEAQLSEVELQEVMVEKPSGPQLGTAKV